MFLPPTIADVSCILHHSRRRECLYVKHLLHLHASLCLLGLDALPPLADHLILMLMETQSPPHARQVFHRLAYQDRNSWAFLIIGYAKCQEPRLALFVYQKMQECGSFEHPGGHALVALLKACTDLQDLDMGCRIHQDVLQQDMVQKDGFVCSALVHMYAQCGSIERAQEVVDALPKRDAVLWNALISGYVDNGHGREALQCLEKMEEEGITPSAVTILCSLTACGSTKEEIKGHKLHAEVIAQGLEEDLMICNSLVDMYAKCGCLDASRAVFDKISDRDAVSWNALISGHVEERELVGEGIELFEEMKRDGVAPDDVTFLCCLKACSLLGSMEKSQEMHSEIVSFGLESRPFVGNKLVDMYIKCGLPRAAEEVFDRLPSQDSILWNVLIAGYVDLGYGEEALRSFETMQACRVSPTSATFVCALKACASIEATTRGKEIHSEIVKKGMEQELLVGSTLVHTYAACAELEGAQAVLVVLRKRTVISWNALIAGYAKLGFGDEALGCIKEMQTEGLVPDAGTLVCALKACSSRRTIIKCREMYARIVCAGFESESLVGNILVDMYATCGLLIDAQGVFDVLLIRDVASWSSLIAGYTELGLYEEVLHRMEDLRNDAVHPDPIVFASLLKSCGRTGAAIKGQELHSDITKSGLEQEPLVANMVVDMYANCGSLAEAEDVFEGLPLQEQVMWNVLISGYAQLAESEKVIRVFGRMVDNGTEPNSITFVSVLNACSHAGLLDAGFLFFEAISHAFDLIPNLKHCTCMVDLLGRAGLIDEATEVIDVMPENPDMAVWLILLGACRKWNDVGLGSYAFEHAVELYEGDSSAYVCMSNICMNASVQREARLKDTACSRAFHCSN